MQSDQHLNYRSGDLSVCPELGTVSNSRGEFARLGPVNMRVLALLISSPQTLVSRYHIFEQVWKNQVVSDDALTRCISDIRSQLKLLCPEQEFIETLPRRGYRWLQPVSATDEPGVKAATEAQKSDNTHTKDRARPIVSWLSRVLLYLLILVVVASSGVWLLDLFSQPDSPIIAVLPTQSSSSTAPLAADIEEAVKAQILSLRQLQLLSQTAVATRPSNPFPYFYFEFGVRWVVESEVRPIAGIKVVILTLVDARTGIVVYQVKEPIGDDDNNWRNSRALTEFIGYLESVDGI